MGSGARRLFYLDQKQPTTLYRYWLNGNGTQAAFYDNPNVLTISIHQDRCYPQDPVDESDGWT